MDSVGNVCLGSVEKIWIRSDDVRIQGGVITGGYV